MYQPVFALYQKAWITLTPLEKWQGSACVEKTVLIEGVFFSTHLKRMKNLYCSSMVKMKNITPSAAITNKFFPTKSHWRGSRVCVVPGGGRAARKVIPYMDL